MKKFAVLVFPKTGSYDAITGSIPYSLLYLISGIKGFEFRIIDQRVEKNWKKQLLIQLKKAPLCVGISSMTGPQIAHALEVSKFVKSHSAYCLGRNPPFNSS
jgi:hypothetical protein